jgi:hypothetical protein
MNVTSQTSTRRIQIMLNNVISSQSALKIATSIAGNMGLLLEGVFVEDEDLLNVSELTFLREISASTLLQQAVDPQRMQQALTAQARQLERFMQEYASRAGVNCVFRVWRGHVTLASLSAELDAEIFSISGSPAYRQSVLARRQHDVVDTYLLVNPDMPSVKIFDVVNRLSGIMTLRTHVLLATEQSSDMAGNNERIRHLASDLSPQQYDNYTTVEDLVAILHRSDNPVLFISADHPLLVDAGFNKLLRSLAVTVFVVR